MPDVKIKIPASLLAEIKNDLRREHAHAYERAGFLFGKRVIAKPDTHIVYLNQYMSVDDRNYVVDPSVGARINSQAITKAMQHAYTEKKGMFHVHLHDFDFSDLPGFSGTDEDELPPIAKSGLNFVPDEFHGIIVLGNSAINAVVFKKGIELPIKPSQISVLGYPMEFSFPLNRLKKEKNGRYDRQSFLGPTAQSLISKVTIGVIGLGGGGSHIVQQLAHIGFKNYVLFDNDIVKDSNLNRLVGATSEDVTNKTPKFDVSKRVIMSLIPDAEIGGGSYLWQQQADQLKRCDIVVGCVDTFLARRDIEGECRRFFLPYLDIGMDVVTVKPEPPNMFGQVQLSIPGEECLICRGFLSEANLAKEANEYGNAGNRPQVVWANGILASSAIGVLIDFITGWTQNRDKKVYLSYKGNKGHVTDHIKLSYGLPKSCSHYPVANSGPVVY